jgi:peptidoglycan/xylan/chitin deacetylase (PgdA/CDA1 family)
MTHRTIPGVFNAPMTPEAVERRARWVLDSLGAHEVGFGDDLPYREEAWEAVERGERPRGDDLAEAFFHLARVEELNGKRDAHGRFTTPNAGLWEPPVERLRERLGLQPPRWRGARFAVALTHDVDVPWRWTRSGIRAAAGHLRRGAWREARALSAVPVHRLRGTDPNWRFDRIAALEKRAGVRSTFFVLVGHNHPADGPAPEVYERLRPKVVEAVLEGGMEVGLHGSYTAAADAGRLAEEKRALEALAGPVRGHRYHYLRVDPHRNLAPLQELGFSYDSTLGYAGRLGFRAGIAHPFRPWSLEDDRPLDLVEIPLAVMDVTLAEQRYLGLAARVAWRRIAFVLDWAAEHGGGFAILWHTDRFDPWTARGWDRLYEWILQGVRERGGVCLSAGELAEEAAAWPR